MRRFESRDPIENWSWDLRLGFGHDLGVRCLNDLGPGSSKRDLVYVTAYGKWHIHQH